MYFGVYFYFANQLFQEFAFIQQLTIRTIADLKYILVQFFIILFAGARAGPLYFDTQAPRRPRPTRKVTPRLGLEVLLVKHQDLAVAGGC